MNVPNTIRRLDHSRTYTLDDIVAISLLRREVATKLVGDEKVFLCVYTLNELYNFSAFIAVEKHNEYHNKIEV